MSGGFWNPDEDPEYEATPLVSPILPVGYRNPPATKPMVYQESRRDRNDRQDSREHQNWREREELEEMRPRNRSRSPTRRFEEPPPPPPEFYNNAISQTPHFEEVPRLDEKFEKLEWITSPQTLQQSELNSSKGTYETNYEDYCDDGDTVGDVVNLLAKLQENPQLEKAHGKVNPYENVGRSMFSNRTSIQMANLDALAQLTNISGPFSFVDIGGSGGYTDYVFWRRIKDYTMDVCGFGLSFAGDVAFEITKFRPLVKEKINNDKIFQQFTLQDNLDGLQEVVNQVEEKCPKGVSLVLAHAKLDEMDHAKSNRRLFMEFLVAIHVLSNEGNLILTVSHLTHPLPVSLLFVMYKSFEKISIVKPLMSRAVSSEKFIVAKGFKATVKSDLTKHLSSLINEADLKSVVDEDLLQQGKFHTWLSTRNLRLYMEQLNALEALEEYLKDGTHDEERIDEEALLRAWKLMK